MSTREQRFVVTGMVALFLLVSALFLLSALACGHNSHYTAPTVMCGVAWLVLVARIILEVERL